MKRTGFTGTAGLIAAVIVLVACNTSDDDDASPIGPTVACAQQAGKGPLDCTCSSSSSSSSATASVSVCSEDLTASRMCCANAWPSGANGTCACSIEFAAACVKTGGGLCLCYPGSRATDPGDQAVPSCVKEGAKRCCARKSDNHCTCGTLQCDPDEVDVNECKPATSTCPLSAPTHVKDCFTDSAPEL